MARSPRAFVSSFWQTERGLSAMLAFLVLDLFVVSPLVSMGVIGPFLFNVFFALIVLSGVAAFWDQRLLMVAVLSVFAATVAFQWAADWLPGAVGVWDDALTILTLSIVAALVLVQVFRDGPITRHRIQGAIVVYLLLGLIWMSAYKLLLRIVPGAIHFASGEPGDLKLGHGLAYYSFVTLTTVGYGDITPVHPIARSLAAGEALVGQLYPAILIARLVSMQLASRDQK